MAKMFYTLDEAKAALGKSDEDIKQLSREGRLREFRDGPRLMFKADQVEALKAELQGGGSLDHLDLGPSDSGMAIGLADSKGAGGGLDAGSGISGSGLTLSEAPGNSPGAGMSLKEDTALAADLGLSGSIGGMPSPARTGGSGTGLSGSQGSKPGVDVFQNDDVDRVDPSAQTAISASHELGGTDSVGSGSGLLDLTRESDDTSLGAELLDEIAPGGSVAGRRTGDTGAGASALGGTGLAGTAFGGTGVVEIRGGAAPAAGRGQAGGGVIYEERADPMAAAFGGAALGASLVVLFGAFALITGMLDTGPEILTQVTKFGFLGVAGGGLAITLIFFVVGLVIGKSAAR